MSSSEQAQPGELGRPGRRGAGRLRRGLVAGALVLLPAVILAGAWRLGGVSALEDDLLYYLPIRQYIGERIRAGEFPLWNPLVLMGSSIAADPQSGLWYPPTYLFVLLPPLTAYPVSIVLHFALAGAGMYRFLRASRHDWRAAFLGAVAFEFCGYLVAHRAHLTIHHAVAWLPWMLYGWRRFALDTRRGKAARAAEGKAPSQRFANRGRYRYFALAAAAFGLHMLVQHTQIAVMVVILVSAYVAVVLWPKRRSLWWEYPAGMVLGAMLGAIQTIPTAFHLFASGRAATSYALFVENSWVPTSSLLLLFPMLFGSRTPNLWSVPWWGVSHFCEQAAYGSIAILLLAGASLTLLRRRMGEGIAVSGQLSAFRGRGCGEGEDGGQDARPPKDGGQDARPPKDGGQDARPPRRDREVLFWWGAAGVALLLALGGLTPLGRVLFHVPIYRNLRAPARWILVWSVAMPVLASIVVSGILRNGPDAARLRASVRWWAVRVLPALAGVCLILMGVARLRISALQRHYGHRYGAVWTLEGLRTAISPGNPAIWWPLLLMIVTAWVVVRWLRRGRAVDFSLLFLVMLIDLTSVAAFVDVDTSTYRRQDLEQPPPLAEAIGSLGPRPGDRLLVPRHSADYRRPIEVLWPQTNIRHGVATFNSYGPFWPVANRLLFRFMPWGSSEGMLELLRQPRLMRAMGIRFLAVRNEQERSLLETAMLPPLETPEVRPIAGTEGMKPVHKGEGLLWPIRIDRTGLYELTFDAEPVPGSASQWYVRLETSPEVGIGRTRTMEPTDLALGPRRFRLLFECPEAVGAAYVRVKAAMGHALWAGRASFGRVAVSAVDATKASQPTLLPADTADAAGGRPPWVHRGDLPGGISLYEVPDVAALVRLAPQVVTVPDLAAAVERLESGTGASASGELAVLEWPGEGQPPPERSEGRVSWERKAGGLIQATVDSPTGGVLVVNESYDPGWTATINGVPGRILRANAVCQAVRVPAGRCEVRFSYRPRGLPAGAALSGLAVGLLAVGASVGRSQPGRRPRS